MVSALDERPLKRVQDHIKDNLETDLTVTVGCLSEPASPRQRVQTAMRESPNCCVGRVGEFQTG